MIRPEARFPFRLTGRDFARRRRAFTLLELLIVIGIMGILAATSLPAIRSLTSTNKEASGQRQVLDDLGRARQLAINNRATVYLVYVPPTVGRQFSILQRTRGLPPADKQRQLMLLTNLFAQQYTAYALFSRRSVGDQPGQSQPRYLTDWQALPEGMLFTTNKFVELSKETWEQVSRGTSAIYRPLSYGWFPFPAATSPPMRLPYVAFDAAGRITYDDDRQPAQPGEVVSVSKGSILYARESDGRVALSGGPDIVVEPRTNRVNVLINWLTGRARVEEIEMP